MHTSTTVYPRHITLNKYYWLRRPHDLNLKLVCVKRIEDTTVMVKFEDDSLLAVTKSELLEFDPNNKLFKSLMKSTNYRYNQYIKIVLHKMGYNPDLYMIDKKDALVTTDSDIDEKTFYDEYERFTKMEGAFCDELMPHIRDIKVTGTVDLSVYDLYKIVCENGGMNSVTNDQKWKSLFYISMSKTNVSYTIRTFYKKFLYEFEMLRRGPEDTLDHQYKFNVKDHIYINVKDEIYYGSVKLRRNRGINQYYIQFYLWSRENSEWFSEDVLNIFPGIFSSKNHIKRKTRSSKANNLIDDPLTREKHSHVSNKHLNKEMKALRSDTSLITKAQNGENTERNSRALSFLNSNNTKGDLTEKEQSNEFICNDQLICENNFFPIEKDFASENLDASMNARENKERKEIKRNNILARTTSKRKQKIVKMLQEMDILDESGKMTEENYKFLSFFNL